jgi:hypothetical protein
LDPFRATTIAKGHSSQPTRFHQSREILAEVFGVKLSEVDEMIENRFQAGDVVESRSREDGLWPQELWIEGSA